MRNRTGLLLALGAAVISGFAVYTNSYGVRAFGNATVYTTAKNLVAAVVLAVALAAVSRRAARAGRPRPEPLRPAQWAGLAAVAVIGGSVPFLLFFHGLALVSSSNAAFIQKTLVVWVAVLAVPLLRERLSAWHVVAIAGLVGGQALLGGGRGGIGLGTGQVLILAATVMWAVETVVARRLLGGLPALTDERFRGRPDAAGSRSPGRSRPTPYRITASTCWACIPGRGCCARAAPSRRCGSWTAGVRSAGQTRSPCCAAR